MNNNRDIYKVQTVPFSVPSCRGTKIEISNLIFIHRLMKITILMKNVIILHEAVCDAAAPSYTVGEEEGEDDEVNGAPLSDAASEPLPELSDSVHAVLGLEFPLLPEQRTIVTSTLHASYVNWYTSFYF